MSGKLKNHELAQLRKAAEYLDAEAHIWVEGFTTIKQGVVFWPDEYGWAHVRWLKLTTASRNVRAIIKRCSPKDPEYFI